jgi:hypothetical protein
MKRFLRENKEPTNNGLLAFELGLGYNPSVATTSASVISRISAICQIYVP